MTARGGHWLFSQIEWIRCFRLPEAPDVQDDDVYVDGKRRKYQAKRQKYISLGMLAESKMVG